ncbi:JNK1/MAPK8-associated membrane protein isoform X2 [Diachasmimorpha longicaudata]|uniref:JNK1/MAPK8-associated membrane protein isoform X2 n=1 Tax=Diachasmimorpha longicaudata TaxID=58733 RepID=UPI0030B86DAA
MNLLEKCPGLYCGREFLEDGNWTECGACPRGFKTNESSICVPCTDTPMFYDWLYLGFMALLALVLHWFCIDMVAMRRNIPKEVIALHLSALVEIIAASLITLQVTQPIGSFEIQSCRIKRLSDWYTLLHNPSPNYESSLHCTQEAVYPFYFLQIYHGFHILFIRSFVDASREASNRQKIPPQARKIFHLRCIVLLPHISVASCSWRWINLLFVSIHHDHPFSPIECSSLRFSIEPDYEIATTKLPIEC